MIKYSWTYIMTNKSHSALYTGVTTDIENRVEQHRAGTGSAFTRKYRCHKLAYFEKFGHVSLAIAREKQIKAGSRTDKISLVNTTNPEWKDLSEKWRRSADEIASSGRPGDVVREGQDLGGRPSSQ